jgi:hypothetical protein
MNQQNTSVTRVGFDLRGLLALTSVAAFVSMVSQVEAGLAIVFAVIFAWCGLMAHLNPVGSTSRYRAVVFVFLIGLTIASLATALQYFVFGSRPYLMWGTVLAAAIGTSLAAIAVCRPTVGRWLKRIVTSIVLIACCYLGLYGYLYRHQIHLSARHDCSFCPRFEFMQEVGRDGFILNHLRASTGLVEICGVGIRSELSLPEWTALFDIDSMSYVQFANIKIDCQSSPLAESSIDTLYFDHCELTGESIAAIATKSKATFIQLVNCQVDSFKGFSGANELQYLRLQKTPITEQLLDELWRLPKLRILSVEPGALTDSQHDCIRAKNASVKIQLEKAS